MPSHLPDPSFSGPLTVSVSVEIDAPIEKVWEVLLDFTNYAECQVVTDEHKHPLADQTPVPGVHLLLRVHIPPTMDDSVSTTSAFEMITHVDPAAHRIAWKNVNAPRLLRAERWQVLSTNEAGGTRYETSEAFGGIGAYIVKWFIGEKLQKSFEAMAEGLKAYAERKYGGT
ncbi:hypothetical protein BD414DRAFT_413291 [Trametes punicea]|nr:hypothetical protein BD414DRAFT_413291 [Trametes punicea]